MTLAELIAAPESVADLSAIERAAMLGQALALIGLLAAPAPMPTPQVEEPPRLLRIREAAERLGMTRDYLHRHWRVLGFVKGLDGRLRISAQRVAKIVAKTH